MQPQPEVEVPQTRSPPTEFADPPEGAIPLDSGAVPATRGRSSSAPNGAPGSQARYAVKMVSFIPGMRKANGLSAVPGMRKARKFEISVGSMGVTMFDGDKPKESFIYANMCRWEVTAGGFTLVVGHDARAIEFITEEGEEIVELITIHAREIAERYLAEKQKQAEVGRKAEKLARDASRKLEKEEQKRQKQTSLLPPALLEPPVAAAPAQHQPASARASSPSPAPAPLVEMDAAGDVEMIAMKRGRAQQMVEQAVAIMGDADRIDDYETAQRLCENALELDPECEMAKTFLKSVQHAIGTQLGPEESEGKAKERLSKLGKAAGKGLWAAGGIAVAAAPRGHGRRPRGRVVRVAPACHGQPRVGVRAHGGHGARWPRAALFHFFYLGSRVRPSGCTRYYREM